MSLRLEIHKKDFLLSTGLLKQEDFRDANSVSDFQHQIHYPLIRTSKVHLYMMKGTLVTTFAQFSSVRLQNKENVSFMFLKRKEVHSKGMN